MGRREGPSEERRQAILAAAEQAFAAHGYSGASIRQIARQAGVSSALLYWFFPDKAALFVAVLTSRVLQDDLPIFFPPGFIDLPPEIVISFIAQHYLEALTQPTQLNLLLLMMREGSREPELVGRLAQELLSHILAPFRQYLSRQVELGRMRDLEPELATQALFGMLISFILRREVLKEQTINRFSNEQIAAAVADLFLHGAAGSGPGPALDQLKPPEREEGRKVRRIEIEE